MDGTHPKVYVAEGGHASYFESGTTGTGVTDHHEGNGRKLDSSDYLINHVTNQDWLNFKGDWGEDSGSVGFLTMSSWEKSRANSGDYPSIPSLSEIKTARNQEKIDEMQQTLVQTISPSYGDALSVLLAGIAPGLAPLGTLVSGLEAIDTLDTNIQNYKELVVWNEDCDMTGQDSYKGGSYHQIRRGFEIIKNMISDTHGESYARNYLEKYTKVLDDISDDIKNYQYKSHSMFHNVNSFNNNIDNIFGPKISNSVDISFSIEVGDNDISIVNDGTDIKTGVNIRRLEYSYLLMANHISDIFGDEDMYANNVIGPQVFDPKVYVGDVAEKLVAQYYGIYQTLLYSRLYLQELVDYS